MDGIFMYASYTSETFKLKESQLTDIIKRVITEQSYGGGIIQQQDEPCDIWCGLKIAERGSNGDVVKMIQHVLAKGCGENYGPYNPEKMGGGMNSGCAEEWGACDGKFGPETKKAVEEFQREVQAQLTVDGRVGINTLSVLCKYCSSLAGGPTDSAQTGSLCNRDCDCDDREERIDIDVDIDDVDVNIDMDDVSDVYERIGDVDVDDWWDLEGQEDNCERIKACLYYTVKTSTLPKWINFIDCMTGTFKSDPNEKKEKGCAKKCREGKPNIPDGSYGTAVMSYYFDGQKCQSLPVGGGAFRSMKKCKKCCEKRGYPITNKL